MSERMSAERLASIRALVETCRGKKLLFLTPARIATYELLVELDAVMAERDAARAFQKMVRGIAPEVLEGILSDISEDWYAAGWMRGIEDIVWDAMNDRSSRGHQLKPEQKRVLWTLAKVAGWYGGKHADEIAAYQLPEARRLMPEAAKIVMTPRT